MKKLKSIGLLLVFVLALCASRASAVTTQNGVYVSYLCTTFTAELTNAPWCFNPQNSILYVWNGSTAYVAYSGLASSGAVIGTTNQIVVTGGNTISLSPTIHIGTPGTTSATVTLANVTGTGTFTLAQAATTTTYSLTMPATAPSASGQVLSATTAGAGSWIAYPFTIGWDGYLGIVTNAATKTVVAPCTGHFTSLSCTAALTGTCTTAPVINVVNVTGSTAGTGITATTTVGTPVTQAQTLVFTAAQVVGLEQTASPGTCTTPFWGCEATATCP